MSPASYVPCVREDGRYTATARATMTIPTETDRGVDVVPAAELELLVQEAQARWSGAFVVEPHAFVAYLTARLAPSARDAEEMRSHAADLCLACGCTLGVAEALRIFEAALETEVA